MTILAVLAAMTVVVVVGQPRHTPQRLGRVLPRSAAMAPADRARRSSGQLLRPVVAAVALLAGVVVIGGGFGICVGVGAGAVALVAGRGSVAVSVSPDDVGVVVDLVAGCLLAGASMADALDVAAGAASPELRAACRTVAGALRAGIPAEQAWASWSQNPWLAPVARTAVRTSQTGAAAAEALRRTASRLRARRRAAAQRRVMAASVWLVVPLGLCFLPAFVLVAVVPLVVGLLPSLHI